MENIRNEHIRTENEVSMYDQKSGLSSFELNFEPNFEPDRDINMPGANERVNDYNNSLALASREERAALLKNGLTGKDIESQYLKINNIRVIGVNWQDSKS